MFAPEYGTTLDARSAKYRSICLEGAGHNSSRLFITIRDRAGLGKGRFKFAIEMRGVSREAVRIVSPPTRSDYAVESISIASIRVRVLQILSRDIDFEINRSDSSSSSQSPCRFVL